MTEDRLRRIAFDMEGPINRLQQLNYILISLVNQCTREQERESGIYDFLQRNLAPDYEELNQLWKQFFTLVVQKGEKPSIRAVKE